MQNMANVGYAWTQDQLQVPDFLGAHKAKIAAASRIERQVGGST
jgi:hypothetical protein